MIWLPGLLVLVAGAVVGWWLVRRSAGQTTSAKEGARQAKAAENRLRLQDLAQRKQDLLARLQSGVEGLDSGERQRLEIEAAKVLRELDQLADAADGAKDAQGSTRRAAPAGPPAAAMAPAESLAPPPGNWLRRNPLLTGFLFGGGLVGLAALLIFLAARDANNAPNASGPAMGAASSQPSMAPAAQGTSGAGDQPPGHPTTGQAATTPEIDHLTQEVEASPGDVDARRQLAVAFLANNQLVEAFQQAQFVLQAAPQDPDGHMVVGVVRMAMGNLDEAAKSFDTALAGRPNDPVIHLYRGVAWVQSGDNAKAIEVWERGLEAAGGSFPQIEQLLAEARQAVASGNTASIQPNAETSAPPAPTAPPMQAQPATGAAMMGTGGAPGGSAADGPTYPVRIELGAGVSSPPGAVLFVSLRPGPAGSPIAVRRIEGVSFPLEIEVSGTDVMMGGAQLPSEGHLTVRLDRDGNATTREADEPMGTLAVVAGKPAILILTVQR